jgi:hypothetical protein
MGIKESLFHFAGRQFFERPARKHSVVEHAARLAASGDEVRERLAGAAPTPPNVARLRHIIGIERWGQRRLRAFLGEPPTADEHHPYKPTTTEWSALLAEFASARADTVALAGQLTTTDPARTVAHNQFGPLSARGWLRYIHGHARTESKLVK